jgi:uncharacterized lipoprotein NlpE involved in copper resistance
MKNLFALILMAILPFFQTSCIFTQKSAVSEVGKKQPPPVHAVEGNPVATAKPDDHLANNFDWNGKYKGIIPCADCEGIEIELSLFKDESWTMSQKYLGRTADPVNYKGQFTWSEKGKIIQLQSGDKAKWQFRIEENLLIMLDQDGKQIGGDLDESYRLEKVEGF